MANAQNFFNATSAPDPRLNPMMAGLAGGLQGGADQGEYQKQLAMQMYMNNQKQLTDGMNAAIQNHMGGFGQGPAGSTQMQYGGQNAYFDPNGMSPAGMADMSKSALYDAKTADLQGGSFAQNQMKAHIKAVGDAMSANYQAVGSKYQGQMPGNEKLTGLEAFSNDYAAMQDEMNKRYNMGPYSKEQKPDMEDETPQTPDTSWSKSMGLPEGTTVPGTGAPVNQTAAQKMFSTATGQNSLTPRAQRNASKADPAIQAKIDAFKKQGHSTDRIKTDLKAKGMNPDDYNI